MPRPFATEPTEDLMGREDFGQWTVVEYLGKLRHGHSVNDLWFCRCDCGRTQKITKGNLVNHLTSKCVACRAKARKKELTYRSKGHSVWRRLVRHDCCPAWKDFAVYHAWLATQSGRYLRKINDELPHGPTNSYLATETGKGECSRQRLIGYLVRDGADEASATARVRGFSKQRLYQLLSKYEGTA